ncbi:ABC transporter ATP-binding protein [candidate division WOR-3 bacterium]|jgi:ABC-2 type transport system ATP-binding protein|nr:ABC transporter ATP-binding protein [candidate division WOR-3 bacterium]MCK4672490.1 ABC transporter ATP-binding protein [candidate division WOR-3 bacterium]
MKTLVIQNLKKKFSNVWAVKNLNLELNPGEIFVLLGPNGAGKTTTLKLIAGLLHPTDGEIYIKDIDVKKEPIKAKSLIGYIPDEPFIYNKLTGREFINFIAAIYNIKRENYEKRMEDLFKKLEIGDWIDEFSESYSHGMKQKVIMCQLFLHNPDLILIDEPLVGLDPKSSKTVREIFFDLRNKGKTLFICTHTLSFAKDIASRIGIISTGELKFIGNLEQLSRISGAKDIEEIYLKLTEEPVSADIK